MLTETAFFFYLKFEAVISGKISYSPNPKVLIFFLPNISLEWIPLLCQLIAKQDFKISSTVQQGKN